MHKKPPLNAVQIYRARGLNFGLSLHLHSYFVYMRSEGSVESAHLHRLTLPRGYKTFFILNSAEHKIYSAHKCLNANNCWHFNNY